MDMNNLILAGAKSMTAASSFLTEIASAGVRPGSPLSRGETAEDLLDALDVAMRCISSASPHRMEAIKHKCVLVFQLASVTQISGSVPRIWPVDGGAA